MKKDRQIPEISITGDCVYRDGMSEEEMGYSLKEDGASNETGPHNVGLSHENGQQCEEGRQTDISSFLS